MSNWKEYKGGLSIGKVSSEGGVILRDDEYATGGARITLKQGNGIISVACKVNGWFDHTRFFNTLSDAQREYLSMKDALDTMMTLIKSPGASAIQVWESVAAFVRRYP